jgi:excisionase family DNA binding protein
MGDVTMTATQAAAVLGVSADTLRRRVRRGELTAHRDRHGRLLVTVPSTVQADAGTDHTEDRACRQPAGDEVEDAGAVQALQAEMQALEALLTEVRGERDALRQQVVEHAREREQWHERLREAHLLLAQRPALPSPAAEAPNLVSNSNEVRPWWQRWRRPWRRADQ